MGQLLRGVDSLRKSERRSENFWDDVSILFEKKFPDSPEERAAKEGWLTDILRFIQRYGQSLIEADYIRSDDGTVSLHEDLSKALVSASLLDEPDETGSLLDPRSVFEKLGV